MTSRSQFIRHVFGGGWATDFGPTADVGPDQGNRVVLPFLVDAENCVFELDGGPHKMPGTSKLNTSQIQGDSVIKGLYDFWDTGTGASSSQHRIVYVDTKVFRDDADGTFSALFTSLTAGAVPSFSVLEDLLIIALDSTDVPMSWDGTTAQNLAGSPPNFATSITHKNRAWAIGVNANSSRLYYSALLDGADWTGAGSGSIDIDPRDGDRNTAIASHRNELWVFKGPYRGAIHRITGSAPTGDDGFARITFQTGVGAVGQNTLFRFGNDLGFMWSDGTVRSLTATAEFGDFAEVALSRPINDGFLDKRVNLARLKHAWAATGNGGVLIVLPIDASTDNNAAIWMDFRFQPPRWAFLSAIAAGAVASVVDQTDNDRRVLMLAGNDGFVRKWGQSTRTNDGAAIAFKVTLPYLNYGTPAQMKTLGGMVSVGLQPKNAGNVTFGWARDNNAQQTETIPQGGADVLGPVAEGAATPFTLGTSKLGGGRFVERFGQPEEGGEFRAIQYQVTNSVNNEDVELHGIGAEIEPGGLPLSAEN